MTPLTQRQIREQAAGLPGQRIGIRVGEKVLYYDIDADGRVYWLCPRRNNRLQRLRVLDPEFAEFVRGQAKQAKESKNDAVANAGNAPPAGGVV